MSEYNENVSRKTWSRTIEPVAKVIFFVVSLFYCDGLLYNPSIILITFQIGYMDGASDGQTAVFQKSFNVGYKQGLTFGLELGFREANSG